MRNEEAILHPIPYAGVSGGIRSAKLVTAVQTYFFNARLKASGPDRKPVHL
jgi:hypothetical protein